MAPIPGALPQISGRADLSSPQFGILINMTAEIARRAIRLPSRCGPTMLIIMASLVIFALVGIYILHGHKHQDSPNGPAQPVSNGLSTQ